MKGFISAIAVLLAFSWAQAATNVSAEFNPQDNSNLLLSDASLFPLDRSGDDRDDRDRDDDGDTDEDEREPFEFQPGERAFNTARDFVLVKVEAIDRRGKYVIKFLEGPLRGQRGGGWPAEFLAKRRGCSEGICVRDEIINTQREFVKARVVGMQQDGRIVLTFLEGRLRNMTGGHWEHNMVAKTWGCGVEFCVGERAFNMDRNYDKVRVIGIEHNDRYVLRFLSGRLRGQVGGNWSDDSLVAFEDDDDRDRDRDRDRDDRDQD